MIYSSPQVPCERHSGRQASRHCVGFLTESPVTFVTSGINLHSQHEWSLVRRNVRSIPIGSGLRPPQMTIVFLGSIPFLLGLRSLFSSTFSRVSLLVALLGLLFPLNSLTLYTNLSLSILSFFAYSSFKVSLASSFSQAPSLFFRLGRQPVSSLCASPLRVHLHLQSSSQQFSTQRIAIMSSSEDDTPLVRANGRSAGELSSLWRHMVLNLPNPSHHPISSHFSHLF